MSRKNRQSIYLRLLDTPARNKSPEEQLPDVKRIVEQLGLIEWLSPPSLHPAGGFDIRIRSLEKEKPDKLAWMKQLAEAGYRCVI